MLRRWGKPQNFFFAFFNELEKQIIIKIKKTVEVGQQKTILIFTMLIFFLKKEKHL